MILIDDSKKIFNYCPFCDRELNFNYNKFIYKFCDCKNEFSLKCIKLSKKNQYDMYEIIYKKLDKKVYFFCAIKEIQIEFEKFSINIDWVDLNLDDFIGTVNKIDKYANLQLFK